MIEFKSKEKFFKDRKDIHAFCSQCIHNDTKWDLHGHEFFELELFESGEGYQILNGERYEITEGCIHLLTTSDFHEMVWGKDVKQIGVRFDRTQLDKKLQKRFFQGDMPSFTNWRMKNLKPPEK